MAGLISGLTFYPLELLRTRMALRGGMSKLNFRQILTKTVKKEGILGLYKGASPAMLGIVIYKGFGFSGYEYIYRSLAHLHIDEHHLNFASGATSGLLAQIG